MTDNEERADKIIDDWDELGAEWRDLRAAIKKALDEAEARGREEAPCKDHNWQPHGIAERRCSHCGTIRAEIRKINISTLPPYGGQSDD